MANKISKFLLIASFVAILVLPAKTYAVTWFPLVPCGLNKPVDSAGKILPKPWPLADSYYEDCNQCTLVQLGKNIIDMTFFAIVPSVGTLLFMIAGFIILFNARSGKPEGVAKGKEIMTNTAIGIAIILSSWLITNFILRSLAPNQAAGVCTNGVCNNGVVGPCRTNDDCPGTPWYQIQCRTGTLESLVNATTPSGGGTGTGTGGGGSGGGGGASFQCLQSGLNLCQGNTSTGCANSLCSQYAAMINRQATGVATTNVLKAFMEIESSCNISAAGGGSYGLMQLTPPIPQIYASRCNVSASNVNQAWLTNPANAEASICISAQWINALASSQCGSSVRNLYAGYNGGQNGACAPSVSCAGEKSCSGEPVKRWECLYDDPAHTKCNGGTDIMVGYNPTRQGATKILYCAANPGF